MYGLKFTKFQLRVGGVDKMYEANFFWGDRYNFLERREVC